MTWRQKKQMNKQRHKKTRKKMMTWRQKKQTNKQRHKINKNELQKNQQKFAKINKFNSFT